MTGSPAGDLEPAPTAGPTGAPAEHYPVGEIGEIGEIDGGPVGEIGEIGEPDGGPVGEPDGGPVGEPDGHPVGEPDGHPVGEPDGDPGGEIGEPDGDPVGEPDGDPVGEIGKPDGGSVGEIGDPDGDPVEGPLTSDPVVAATRERAPLLRWWREVLYIIAFYSVYSFIRNKGVATDSIAVARRNAVDVIDVERRLGTYHEEAIQDWFLRWPDFIRFWNVFYGTAHFIVTVGALVYLFRRMSSRYPLWRNTLAFTTGLALIGFAFYPLMPPRLLPTGYGFVDTLKVVGGLWSFDSGPVAKVSNQYAAMPSLHFAWSSWCAFVVYPALRRRWAKALMAAYPFLTLFAIVVTANHYWLDAAGGAVTLALGFLLGRALTRLLARRGLQPVPDPAVAESEVGARG